MKHLSLLLVLIAITSGCATTEVYNPLTSPTHQTFLLNESSFAQMNVGMKLAQVHQIMGDTIVVGYAYQKALADGTVSQSSADYKPLTINNPYKTENLKSKEGEYLVEYYVSSIQQPDGTISDNELVPLVFKEGVLVAKGWDYLKALRSKNSAA